MILTVGVRLGTFTIVSENPPAGRRPARRSRSLLVRVTAVAVLLAVWWSVALAQVWPPAILPGPGQVWHQLLSTSDTANGQGGYAGSTLVERLAVSLRRVGYGCVYGILIGVGLGLAMGLVPVVRAVTEPAVTFLRALPPLAYFFLLVIWLGIDEAPKITLLALAALPPAAVATTAAVVAAPVGLQEAARALDASRTEVIRDVVVPSALPETFTGIRLAVGMAYSSVVAAELFNGIPGIGGLVKDASNYNNTPVVLVGIFAIGISGLIIDGLLRAIERRAVPWRGKI
jgi:taurine transport system permease protein